MDLYNQSEGINQERQIYDMQETGDPDHGDCCFSDLGCNLFILAQVQKSAYQDSTGLYIVNIFPSGMNRQT